MATMTQYDARTAAAELRVVLGMDRSRLLHLDAVRGLAALAVAVFHAALLLVPAFAAFTADVWHVGNTATTLFFLLSGMVIPAARARSSPTRYLWRRVLRIWPPAALAILAAALLAQRGVWLGSALEDGRGYTLLPLLLVNLTLTPTLLGVPRILGQTWTLETDVFWYAANLVTLRPWLLLALAGFAALLPSPLTVTLAMCAIGAASGRVRWLVLVCCVLACLRLPDGPGALVGRLVGLALLPALLCPWEAPRWAVWLGDVSYGLYLTHTITFAVLPPILWPLCVPVAWAFERLSRWPVSNPRPPRRRSCWPQSAARSARR